MCVRVIETKNKEVKVHPQQDPQLLIVNLMRIPDLTNCTRLRLWQPVHAGIRRHLSTDNLFNFSCSMNNTSTIYDKQEKAGIHGLLTVWFCTAQLHWV